MKLWDKQLIFLELRDLLSCEILPLNDGEKIYKI